MLGHESSSIITIMRLTERVGRNGRPDDECDWTIHFQSFSNLNRGRPSNSQKVNENCSVAVVFLLIADP
jgi:hypothetical protein